MATLMPSNKSDSPSTSWVDLGPFLTMVPFGSFQEEPPTLHPLRHQWLKNQKRKPTRERPLLPPSHATPERQRAPLSEILADKHPTLQNSANSDSAGLLGPLSPIAGPIPSVVRQNLEAFRLV